MLITTDQYKEHFTNISGAAIDTRLERMIGRADALMAAYCGYRPAAAGGRRTLEATAYTDYPLPGARDRALALQLSVYPIVSVSSVASSSTWDYSTPLVEGTDFEVDQHSGEIWLRPDSKATGAWIDTPRAQRVVYTAGYSALDQDHELVVLCAELTHHLLERPSTKGRRSVAHGGASVTMRDEYELIPEAIRSALEAFVLAESRAS